MFFASDLRRMCVLQLACCDPLQTSDPEGPLTTARIRLVRHQEDGLTYCEECFRRKHKSVFLQMQVRAGVALYIPPDSSSSRRAKPVGRRAPRGAAANLPKWHLRSRIELTPCSRSTRAVKPTFTGKHVRNTRLARSPSSLICSPCRRRFTLILTQ